MHASTFAGLIRQILTFGDNSIEVDTHVKPLAGNGQIAGDGREADGRIFLEVGFCQTVKLLAALFQGQLDQGFPFFIHQQIEKDEDTRMGLAQFQDAASGRMDAHQQCIEGQVAIDGNNNLSIQNKFLGLN